MSVHKFQHLSAISFDKNKQSSDCETCVLAKHHQLPLPTSNSIASACFDLVHIDLWGPYKTPCVSGASYFLTILDDNSRTTWTHLVHNKSQVPKIISDFLSYVEKHFNSDIKTIRSDNGTEIVQHYCQQLFASKGIVQQTSVAGVPQQNGRVECKHRHLLDTARAIKFHANLPTKFWGNCILASTYLINLMPSSVLSWNSPSEVLMHKPPDYSRLRIIGCLCYAAIKTSDKLAPRALKCILLGYSYAKKAYKLYDLDNNKTNILIFDNYNITEIGSPRRARVVKRCAGILVLTILILLSVTCKLSVAFNSIL